MPSYREDESEVLQNGKSKPDICSGIGLPPSSRLSVAASKEQDKPLGERKKAVLRQTLMVIFANSGVIGSGLAVAMPAVTLKQFQDENEQIYLNPSEASWYASINTMACPLGGMLVGYLLDKIGRKRTMLVNNVIGIIGWALIAGAFQKDKDSAFIQILIGRFISGIMIGLFCSPTGVYAAEITLPKIRGKLLLGTAVGLSLGILSMYILGYFIRDSWRLISTICLCYQILCFLLVTPMPESPSWLMQKGRSEESRKSLKFFRGIDKNDNTTYEEFEAEFSQIKKTSQIAADDGKQSLLTSIKEPEVYKPLLIMLGMFFFQQFSGVVVVVVYAVQIAVTAGVKMDPLLCAIFVGLGRILTTCCLGYILETWGRRPAGMVSGSGMATCMLLIAASSWFPVILDHAPFLPAVCIVLQFMFSTMGLLTLPFYMISEVYPQKVRGVASGMTVCIGLIMSFLVLKIYPSMVDVMGNENVFAFYGLVSLLAVFYIYFILPETKGKSLLEIEEYFKTGKFPNRNQPIENEMQEVFIKK
ncbi:facilitated trehalose transporter Tret1-2 homolog [Eupeodes corollae]|uniref:facilitated trehalose transporter Tret1-2 homolog n=1 Tax=Eupeodes corollae TaxID=290404 RepID=UPI0024932FA6|nr:facilitated trehalose transporter Tret1-2 homolog [Eupeodes corollae]